MKEFNLYIQEKLKINSKSKINNTSSLRDLSNVSIPNSLYIDIKSKSPHEYYRNNQKMEEYKKKGSSPVRLLNSIKDRGKLIKRWFIAIYLNWPECARVFRQGIIDRKYYTEDELDAYVLRSYNNNYKSTNTKSDIKNAYINYFNEFNIKYED